MYKYKTKNGEDLVVVGHGVTVNGIIETSTPVENPNLELIQTENVPAQAQVLGTALQSAQPVKHENEHNTNIEESN